MANYKDIIPFIQKWEGGLSNHPLDKGGATNCGVTLNTFRSHYGDDKTIDDLNRMTARQWEEIFLSGYWNPCHATAIASQKVANALVDWAWHSGVKSAIKQVQRLVGVVVDGFIGRKTLKAINNSNPDKLLADIIDARLKFVNAIVERNPKQKIFLKGWINRINDLYNEFNK